MKQLLKRISVIVLTLALVAGTLPSSVFAAKRVAPKKDFLGLEVSAFNVMLTLQPGGESLSGKSTYNDDTELTFTAEPNAGYELEEITYNGVAIEEISPSTYTITVHTGEHEILSVIANDIQAPTIKNVTVEQGWKAEKKISYILEDNSADEIKVVLSQKTDLDSLETIEAALKDKTAIRGGETETTVVEPGAWTIYAYDAAGNLAMQSVEVKDIDKTAPMIESIEAPSNEDWILSGEIKVEATDTESGIASISLQMKGETEKLGEKKADAATFTITSGGTYVITAADKAGNIVSEEIFIEKIDGEAPVINPVDTPVDGQWLNTANPISLEISDSGSGLKSYRYAFGTETHPAADTEWIEEELTAAVAAKTITITPDMEDSFEGYLYLEAEDACGNTENTAVPLAYDFDKPVIEGVYSDEAGYIGKHGEYILYKDKLAIKFECSDSTSGIDSVEYMIADSIPQRKMNEWIAFDDISTMPSVQIIKADSGTHRIFLRATDKAGNKTIVMITKDVTEEYMLEDTPDNGYTEGNVPVITAMAGDTAYSEDTWTNRTVTLSFSGAEFLSGVDHYEYISFSGRPTGEEIWTTASELTFDTDTNATFRVRAVSGTGILSDTADFSVKIQKTIPENAEVAVSLPDGKNNWYITKPEVNVTAAKEAEDAAPITTHIVLTELHLNEDGTFDEGEKNSMKPGAEIKFKDEAIYELRVWTTDAADNKCESDFVKYLKIDCIAPQSQKIEIGENNIVGNSADIRYFYNAEEKASISTDDFAGTSLLSLNDGQKAALGIPENYEPYQYVIRDTGMMNVMPDDKDWTPYDAEKGIVIAPNSRCFIYAMATDAAGNTAIFRTDGIILDDAAPEDAAFTLPKPNNNGFYNADVNVNISCADKNLAGIHSGLRTGTYEVLSDGTVTQIGSFDIDAGAKTFTGSIKIDASKNDSNSVVVVTTFTDRSGNTTKTQSPAMRIDTTSPTLAVSYNNNSAKTVSGISYFSAGRTGTVTVTERNFDTSRTTVTVINTETGKQIPLSAWSNNGDVHTATFNAGENGVYTVSADTTDLADNKCNAPSYIGTAPTAFTVDQTPPAITVTYDNNASANGKYFKNYRTAHITVTDHNLNPNQIQVTTTASYLGKDFAAPNVSGWTKNGDTYTASVVFNKDGDYTINVSCVDLAGNANSSVNYSGSAAQEFTIDTGIDKFEIMGVENKAAYTGDVAPEIDIRDIHLSQYKIALTRISYDKKTDCTEILRSKETKTGVSYYAIYDAIDRARENDGLYILTMEAEDLAGNREEHEVRFTVNRFGSVYVFDSFVTDINGGYHQKVEKDLIITEYNPSGVNNKDANVVITRDGTSITPEYQRDLKQKASDEDKASWNVYTYTIPAANFSEDGLYKISVSGKDAAGIPSDSTETGEIAFVVDSAAPEIIAIKGAEEAIINDSKHSVEFTAYDAHGLKTVRVFVNDRMAAEFVSGVDFEEGTTEFTATIDLPEGLKNKLRFEYTDNAGNVMDTDDPSYADYGMPFENEITVSENFFVRLYANTPAFIASVTGVILLIAAGIILPILLKKHKKQEGKAEDNQ